MQCVGEECGLYRPTDAAVDNHMGWVLPPRVIGGRMLGLGTELSSSTSAVNMEATDKDKDEGQ
jgi:hypothetical protein